AISSTLNRINSTRPANVGLAMLSAYAGTNANGATPGTGGGYIRFGVRDMTNATNRTALQNILAGISANTTDPAEKLAGMASKDEDAAFYEIYKYLSGLANFTGPSNQNSFADVPHNAQSLSGAGQGLTSGFALNNPGASAVYQSPISSGAACASTYIIYIANNANNTGSNGQAAYEPAVANVNPALAATALLDTWTDEWTYFLKTNGVVVPAGNTNGSVVTYVLDAYSAEHNVGYSNLLMNAAKNGGGKYYQIGSQAGSIALGDNSNPPIDAVNTLTGFITPCAQSFWTTDSGTYWQSDIFDSPTPKGGCPRSITGFSAWSDDPDGPMVEKGGVAEVIRKGNNPPATNTIPTWAVNRRVYTLAGLSGTTRTPFTSASVAVLPTQLALGN